MEDKLNVSCDLRSGLFGSDASGELLGLDCEIKASKGMSMGTFSVSFKSVEGKTKVDLDVSKNLIGNLITDGLNLDSLLGSLFK